MFAKSRTLMILSLVLVTAVWAGAARAVEVVEAPAYPWPFDSAAALPTVVDGGEWSAYWQLRNAPANGAYEEMTNGSYGDGYPRWVRASNQRPWVANAPRPHGALGTAALRLAAGRGDGGGYENPNGSDGWSVLGFKATPAAGYHYVNVNVSGTLRTWQHTLYTGQANAFQVELVKLSADGATATTVWSQTLTDPNGAGALSTPWELNAEVGTLSAGESVRLRVREMAAYSWGWVEAADLQISYSVQSAVAEVPAPWPADAADMLPTAVDGGRWSAHWQLRNAAAEDNYNEMTNGTYADSVRRWVRANNGRPWIANAPRPYQGAATTALRLAAARSHGGAYEHPDGPDGLAVLSFEATPEAGQHYDNVTLGGTLRTWQDDLYSGQENRFQVEVIKMAADGASATVVFSDIIAGPDERRVLSAPYYLNVNVGTLAAGESVRLRVKELAAYSWGWVETTDLNVSYDVVEGYLPASYTLPGNWPSSATATDNPLTTAVGTWTAFRQFRHAAQNDPNAPLLTAAYWNYDNYWTNAGGQPAIRSLESDRLRVGVTYYDYTRTDWASNGWLGLAFTPDLPESFSGTATFSGSLEHNRGDKYFSSNGILLVQLYKVSSANELTPLMTKAVEWQTTWDFEVKTDVAPGDTLAIRMRSNSAYSSFTPYIYDYQVTILEGDVVEQEPEPEPGAWDDAHSIDVSAPGHWFSSEILGQNRIQRGALGASESSSIRGTESGLHADAHNWQTLSGFNVNPNTLRFLQDARDRHSTPLITVNSRGTGTGNTAATFVYTDTTLPPLVTLASDWVRYVNFILQDGPANSGDQDILNKISWSPKLPDVGESVPAVAYWEIGNEPEGGYQGFTFAPGEYVERYKAITAAMLAVDPTIKVGPCGTYMYPWETDSPIYQTLNAPEAPIDFVSYHPYTNVGGPEGENPTPSVPTVESRLRAIGGTQQGLFGYLRDTVQAAGRDPDELEYFASEWNAAGFPWYGVEGAQFQALGSAETIFNFANFAAQGLRGAHFWGNLLAIDNHTEYPIYKLFKGMQQYLGDTMVDSYSDGHNFRLYTVRDSQTGQVTIWGLNFSNDSPKTMKLSLSGLEAVGSAQKLTLGGLYDTGGLFRGNSAGNVVFVDWTSRTLDVGAADLADYVVAYPAAAITVLVIDPAPLPGDANGDGVVDLHDFAILAANYGQNGKLWSDGDFTSDGEVTFEDLMVLAANFLGQPQ